MENARALFCTDSWFILAITWNAVVIAHLLFWLLIKLLSGNLRTLLGNILEDDMDWSYRQREREGHAWIPCLLCHVVGQTLRTAILSL
jgi:hypothetical protein